MRWPRWRVGHGDAGGTLQGGGRRREKDQGVLRAVSRGDREMRELSGAGDEWSEEGLRALTWSHAGRPPTPRPHTPNILPSLACPP